MLLTFKWRFVSVFQEGKGNVQVFFQSCGKIRTNIKVNNGWMGVRVLCVLVVYVVERHWLQVVLRIRCRVAVHLYCFDGNENRTSWGNQMSGNHCNNINMWYITTEVTIVLTSRPTYNSQLDVHVVRSSCRNTLPRGT